MLLIDKKGFEGILIVMKEDDMKLQYRHSNHGLFSENYLNEVLPGREIWSQIEKEAKRAFEQILKIY